MVAPTHIMYHATLILRPCTVYSTRVESWEEWRAFLEKGANKSRNYFMFQISTKEESQNFIVWLEIFLYSSRWPGYWPIFIKGSFLRLKRKYTYYQKEVSLFASICCTLTFVRQPAEYSLQEEGRKRRNQVCLFILFLISMLPFAACEAAPSRLLTYKWIIR